MVNGLSIVDWQARLGGAVAAQRFISQTARRRIAKAVSPPMMAQTIPSHLPHCHSPCRGLW
jgi:hypothetical protein